MIGGRTSSETLRGRTQNGRVSCDFQAASAETLRGRSKNSGVGRRSVTPASKELRRRGCILIWSNDRGGAPALKHCAGAYKMEGLVVTSKPQALKHCAGAAKMTGVGRGSVTVGVKGIAAEGVYINME